MAENKIQSNMSFKVTQGDDILGLASNPFEAGLVIAVFDYFKIPINTTKFFLGFNARAAEFLRHIIGPNMISGYPARVLPSTMFRKPWSEAGQSAYDRARVSASVWTKFYRRMGVSIMYHMYEDVSRILKLSIEEVKVIIHSTSVNGGFAVMPVVLASKVIWEKAESSAKVRRKRDRFSRS